MCKVFAIVNQKGGVGKTTTSINLSTAIAVINNPTLLIDLDPQGNSSTGLGISHSKRTVTSYDVLVNNVPISSSILNTDIPNLSLLSSNVDLSAAEIELTQREKREFILKKALSSIKNTYKYIFIDCPPSLGLLTINALIAADSVIVPLQCEFFALEGLSHLMKTIELIKKHLNPHLQIEGILLTMYDKRNKLNEQVENDIRKYLKEVVYKTVIPRNIRLSEAPSHGKPSIIYDFKCAGSQAYIYLAKEILDKNNPYKNSVKGYK
ncbi:ParA family protein [Neoehrlichia mikurensis]|uniref:Chromosome partitioning protein ParA n=1 Tax=Neoehrlichia mikurensis TaxID=89586 RepID=A0A9Q9BW79_9RICK|nr:AAA family ATPase [Neoehrlichia mikurensis]QXK91587.1 ParA family protein [Neoehrlichia mikurensis]QXK92798.1 ParA family protein [Neoehrlichia mikurensis]QXK93277.1 ParA family protein [Neoehrlichia mikurensis]UTO55793.1 AAA family ATPase [Neoehrlichia mikurensis]UTO56708.1 AAA family ATPase [Neoehrlichia mikurensis]